MDRLRMNPKASYIYSETDCNTTYNPSWDCIPLVNILFYKYVSPSGLN